VALYSRGGKGSRGGTVRETNYLKLNTQHPTAGVYRFDKFSDVGRGGACGRKQRTEGWGGC